MLSTALVILAALAGSTATAAYTPPSSFFGAPGVNRTFDYVVVGGGTAGLTMAARLSEGGQHTVAVIEAGGFYQVDNGNISVVPGFGTFFAGSAPNDTQPLIDWGFVTTPQAGADNRVMHYARGKTLGGCSARNYMVYQRPTVDSFQRWADEVGDSSYTFANLLPFFEKSPQLNTKSQGIQPNASNQQTNPGFSGSGGPLKVSYPNFVDAFATWTRLALQAVGQKAIDGFNTGSLIGSAWVTWTIDQKNAHRSSSESSFLRAAVEQKNSLQIYPHTLAQKVLFTKQTANGVLVTTNGTNGAPETYLLSAKKEVIVSAGAFQSPQLLMVSGVGPAAILQKYSIPVVKNAPGVGQNMWDQPFWGVSYRVDLPTASAPQNNPAIAYAADAAWKQNASGPLSEFGSGYFGWEKLPADLRSSLSNSTLAKLAAFPADWPEVEYLPVNAYLGYQRDYQTEDPLDGTNYATMAVGLITPSSLGNISISSSRMSDSPLINPNWLTDPADSELAVAIFKRQREIWAQLTKLGVTVGPEALPGTKVQSDADILSYIRASMIQLYHASATCKMGQSNDTMAVVDSQARVYGVQGLRVVDASAFPFLPPGHPQATVYALAEKIAAGMMK